MTRPPRRRRTTFWLLVALFFGPLTLSFTWYYLLEDLRMEPRAQHGELIQPPRALPEVTLSDGSRSLASAELLRGRWSVVYVAPGDCPAVCRERLVDLRQMRLALGRDRTRVQQVWFYSGAAPDAAWLRQEHPELVTVALDHGQAEELLAVFPDAQGRRLDRADAVYLVDPLGNLMMRYSSEVELRGIHEDLERLLRLSSIG